MLEGAKGAVKSGVGTVNRLLGMVSNRQIPINTEPSNTAQKLGGMVEQAGEFALPAAGVGAVAKGLPLVNALGQAATAYGVSKVQGASETGSRVNAALGALGPVVSEALPVIGQKIRDTAVTQLAQKLTKGLASPGPDVTYALKTGDVGPDVKQAVGIVRQAASDILDAPIQLGWGKWMTTLARDAAEKGKTLGQAIKGSLGQVMVPVQPILDEFDKLSGQLAEHAIPGKGGSVTTIVRNPALGDAIQDLKDIVSKYPGGQISIEHLSDLKRTWDDAVYTLATEGKVGVDAAALANTAKKKAMETGANAIRRVLEQQAPDIAALNEAASHAYRLQSLVKNLYSKQPGVGPLGQSIAHSVGGFAGYGVGELIGHPLMGMGAGTTLGGRLLVKTVESPLFQTFSAARKNMIAKAIAAGDQAGLVKALTSGVQATTSSATEATAPK